MSRTKKIMVANGSNEGCRLTPQQESFCQHLVRDPQFNLTNAARAAGYATPSVSATDVMKSPEVQKYLGALLKKRGENYEITAERVLKELASIGLFNPLMLLNPDGSLIPLKDLPWEVTAAISSMTITYGEDMEEDGSFTRTKNVNIKFHDKLVALKQLAEHVGIIKGITQFTQININWGDLIGRDPQRPNSIEARLLEATKAAKKQPVPPEQDIGPAGVAGDLSDRSVDVEPRNAAPSVIDMTPDGKVIDESRDADNRSDHSSAAAPPAPLPPPTLAPKPSQLGRPSKGGKPKAGPL